LKILIFKRDKVMEMIENPMVIGGCEIDWKGDDLSYGDKD